MQDGSESPDAQGHATDWRFAVCSFGEAWEEEEPPALQMQVPDPIPPRTMVEAALDSGLQLPPEQTVSASGHSEDTAPSGVESLLLPMSSMLSLAQGEGASPESGWTGNSGQVRVVPAGLGPGVLDGASVDLGDPSVETSPKLLEAGKGGGAQGKGVGMLWRGGVETLEVLSVPTQPKRVREGGLWAGGEVMTQSFPFRRFQ